MNDENETGCIHVPEYCACELATMKKIVGVYEKALTDLDHIELHFGAKGGVFNPRTMTYEYKDLGSGNLNLAQQALSEAKKLRGEG